MEPLLIPLKVPYFIIIDGQVSLKFNTFKGIKNFLYIGKVRYVIKKFLYWGKGKSRLLKFFYI